MPVILERSEESGQRIQALNTFCDYPLPDSSLRVILCFFFYHHFGSYHRSRMTAGVLRFSTVLKTCPSFLNEVKNPGRGWRYEMYFPVPMPDSSLLIAICFLIFHFFMYACHRSRMTARVLRFLVLHSCLSFSNERKMRSGIEK